MAQVLGGAQARAGRGHPAALRHLGANGSESAIGYVRAGGGLGVRWYGAAWRRLCASHAARVFGAALGGLHAQQRQNRRCIFGRLAWHASLYFDELGPQYFQRKHIGTRAWPFDAFLHGVANPAAGLLQLLAVCCGGCFKL